MRLMRCQFSWWFAASRQHGHIGNLTFLGVSLSFVCFLWSPPVGILSSEIKPTREVAENTLVSLEDTPRPEPTNTPMPTDDSKTPSADTSEFTSFDTVLAVLFLCIVPVGFVATGALSVMLYSRLRVQQKLSKDLRTAGQRLSENLKAEIQNLNTDAQQVFLEKWFEDIKTHSYRNEIEVEVKFIYPLLKFLGYHDNDLDIRVPVDVQVGRNFAKGEADWVIWNRTTTETNPKVTVVIEAKASSQRLDQEVKGQARSYAFALNAPAYVITNGARFQIFQRGIQEDDCIVDCSVNALASKWSIIRKTIGCRN